MKICFSKQFLFLCVEKLLHQICVKDQPSIYHRLFSIKVYYENSFSYIHKPQEASELSTCECTDKFSTENVRHKTFWDKRLPHARVWKHWMRFLKKKLYEVFSNIYIDFQTKEGTASSSPSKQMLICIPQHKWQTK